MPKPKDHPPQCSNRDEQLQDGEVYLEHFEASHDEWISQVQWQALTHKSCVKAACELPEHERPQRLRTVNKALMDSATKALGNLAPDIPSHKIKLVVHVLAGAGRLDSVDLGDARRLPLPVTKKNALLVLMPELQKFRLRPPFGGKPCHTWALVHGTSVSVAQRVHLDSVDLQYLLTFSCVKFTPNHTGTEDAALLTQKTRANSRS